MIDGVKSMWCSQSAVQVEHQFVWGMTKLDGVKTSKFSAKPSPPAAPAAFLGVSRLDIYIPVRLSNFAED